MSRDAFELAGGFDERFARFGGEDVELCVRLWRAPRPSVPHPAPRRGGAPLPPRQRRRDGPRGRDLQPAPDRIAALQPRKLATLRRTLGRSKAFEAADVRLAASDVRERRAALDAAAVVDPDWFFNRFGLTFFEDAE
jgi:hypothetical protein